MSDEGKAKKPTSLKPGTETAEITWAGKKLIVDKKYLDKWYDNSYENRDWFVKEKPWIVEAIPTKKFKNMDKYADLEQSDDEGPDSTSKSTTIDMSEFVIVHFSGKSLLLKRDTLQEEWNSLSPMEKGQYVKDHPEALITLD